MSKFKKIIILSSSFLLLTGCKNNKELVCTLNESGQNVAYTFTFNKDKSQLEQVKWSKSIPIMEEDISDIEASLANYCDRYTGYLENCQAQLKDNNFIVEGNISANEINQIFADDSSYDTVMQRYSSSGYSCQ